MRDSLCGIFADTLLIAKRHEYADISKAIRIPCHWHIQQPEINLTFNACFCHATMSFLVIFSPSNINVFLLGQPNCAQKICVAKLKNSFQSIVLSSHRASEYEVTESTHSTSICSSTQIHPFVIFDHKFSHLHTHTERIQFEPRAVNGSSSRKSGADRLINSFYAVCKISSYWIVN